MKRRSFIQGLAAASAALVITLKAPPVVVAEESLGHGKHMEAHSQFAEMFMERMPFMEDVFYEHYEEHAVRKFFQGAKEPKVDWRYGKWKREENSQ